MPLARDRILLTTAVVSGAADETYYPITGINFAAQLGYRYHVRACVCYTAAANTTAARIGLSASPTTAPTLAAFTVMTATGITAIAGGGYTGIVTTASTTGGITAPATGSGVGTAGTVITLEGFYVPAATQVLQLEIAPEEAAAVTVQIGSYLEWEIVS